jgi:hypothetical protein
MSKLPITILAVAALAVGVGVGATQPGGNGHGAQTPAAAVSKSAALTRDAYVIPTTRRKAATPQAAKLRADCRRDVLSDSSSDNRDVALANGGCSIDEQYSRRHHHHHGGDDHHHHGDDDA